MKRRRGATTIIGTILFLSLIPEPAVGTHSRWLLMKPPVGSYDGDAHMNQGYHSPENAVDWDDEDGDGTCCGVGRNVYFNAWLYRDSATSQATLWVGYYQSNVISPQCARLRAVLKEYTDQSRILGYMNYRHSNWDGSGGHSCSGSSAGIACRNGIGTMQSQAQRDASGDTCGWSGPHVHSGHTTGPYGVWTLNVGSAPGAIPNGSGVWTYHNPGYESAVTERRVDWCNPDSIC